MTKGWNVTELELWKQGKNTLDANFLLRCFLSN